MDPDRLRSNRDRADAGRTANPVPFRNERRPGPADEPADRPASPLEPWPDTVRWQPVSRNLIWVELIRLGSVRGGARACLGVGLGV